MRGPEHHNWKGGRAKDGRYISLYMPTHPHANVAGRVLEHVAFACAALGKPLPTNAIVHHVNEDPRDNTPGNLVVCENRAYHNLLHRRLRALKAIGDANGLPCRVCCRYDHQKNLRVYTERGSGRISGVHPKCQSTHNRAMHARRRTA